jgi:hypothetical protein
MPRSLPVMAPSCCALCSCTTAGGSGSLVLGSVAVVLSIEFLSTALVSVAIFHKIGKLLFCAADKKEEKMTRTLLSLFSCCCVVVVAAREI